jgi:hypothetical protein
MVATNKYIDRWKDAAKDIEEVAFKDNPEVRIHLFTDRVDEAREWASKNLSRIGLAVHEIPGWGWPEATLLRYEFFVERKRMLNEDLLIYLDSDMRIIRDPGQYLFSNVNEYISVVSHPGYYRPPGTSLLAFYLASPKTLLSDFLAILFHGTGPGAWESSKKSMAFVPRTFRKKYVHGAFWCGERETFLALCEELQTRTKEDLENGIIAKWHDESHLNWYISKYKYNLLDNRMSWVENYKNLNEYAENYCISNVQKVPGEGREPSHA